MKKITMITRANKLINNGLCDLTISELKKVNPNDKIWITNSKPLYSLDMLTIEQLEEELYKRRAMDRLKDDIDEYMMDKLLQAQQHGLNLEYTISCVKK